MLTIQAIIAIFKRAKSSVGASFIIYRGYGKSTCPPAQRNRRYKNGKARTYIHLSVTKPHVFFILIKTLLFSTTFIICH